MSTINYLTVRNTVLPVVNTVTMTYSTLTGSTITASTMSGFSATLSTLFVSSINSAAPGTGSGGPISTLTASSIILNSTQVSLGRNAASTAGANLSNGTFTNWITAKSGLTALKSVATSSTGQFQFATLNGALWYSSTSGVTWTQPTAYGLPNLATYSVGSASMSKDGLYLTIGITGDYVYVSADRGLTFNNPAPSYTPYSYLPLQGSTTDVYGNTVTVSASVPGYASKGPLTGIANSVNLNNTPAGTATQYLRVPWTGSSAFSISMWVNFQSIGTQQNFCQFGSSGGFVLYLQNTNYLTVYLNSTIVASTSYAITANTWYFLTAIFTANGFGSFYVNNALIGTFNCGANPSGTSTGFVSLGCNGDTSQAFNGYIADFRLYNSAITYQAIPVLPPYSWFRFENNITDSMGILTPTATGTIAYVPGMAGASAAYFYNPTVSAATTNLSGSWTPGNAFSMSFRFNIQSANVTSQSGIVGTANGASFGLSLLVGSNTVYVQYYASDTTYPTIQAYNIAGFTWYTALITYQYPGTVSFYLNGVLVGTAASKAFSVAPNSYRVASYPHAAGGAVSCYVDDLKLYSYVVSPSQLSPSNWTAIGVSGNGQYHLAGTDDGYLYESTTNGASWAAQTTASSAGSFRSVSLSHTGQNITALAQAAILPNQTGLTVSGTTTTWTQGGVTWTASASSIYNTTFYAGYAFENTALGGWDSGSNYASGGANPSAATTAYSTTILGGIGAINGDWLQLQSSVPLVMSSWTAILMSFSQFAPTYYIVGSNDGTSWYPLQYGNVTSLPATSGSYAVISTPIAINYTGTQAMIGTSVGSVTTTSYAYSSTPYTYFRFIGTASAGAQQIGFGEWQPRFLSANTYQPNQTGITTPTWAVNNVTYTASASSIYGAGNEAYRVFDSANASWTSSGPYTGGTGVYYGSSSTAIQTVGTVNGEYLQLQTSIPLILSAYSYTSGGNSGILLPKTFYLLGSNDGTTWYPLQYTTTTTLPISAINTACKTQILVNYTGTQTPYGNQAGSLSTTAYSAYVNNTYTYFRMHIVTINTPANNAAEIGELSLTFLGGQSYSSTYGTSWSAVANVYYSSLLEVTPSGQYSIGFNNMPMTARMTMDGSGADSMGTLAAPTVTGTVSYSNSVYKVGTASAYFANTAGATSGSYLSYTLPSWMNAPNTFTLGGWVYYTSFPASGNDSFIGLTHGDGTVAFMLNVAVGGGCNLPIWSSGNTGGVTITGSTLSLNTWYHMMGVISPGLATLYVNGISQGAVAYSGTLQTNAATTITNLFVGTEHATYGYFAGYVDDVRLYPHALTASQVYALYSAPTSQQLALTSNYLSGLSSAPSSYVLAGNTAPLVESAQSYTGQVMVIISSATSGNNVWYSTNYGVTWTGYALTVTAPLVSCAVSYDGSYITVASATTVYTLNNNGTATYSLALGSSAGSIAQGSNAVAIGNQAGQTNQSANSIVVNASGSALSAAVSGLYVAPIASSITSATSTVSLLGYGADSQVTQTGISAWATGQLNACTIRQNILTTSINPTINLTTTGGSSVFLANWLGQGAYNNIVQTGDFGMINLDSNNNVGYPSAGIVIANWNQTAGLRVGTTAVTMYGNVGIGTASPATALHVAGTVTANTFSAPTGNYLNITNGAGSGSIALQGGSILFQNSYVGIGTASPIAALHVSNATAAGSGYGLVVIDSANAGGAGGALTLRNSGGGNGAFASLLFENDGSTSVATGSTPTAFNQANGMIYCQNLTTTYGNNAAKMGFQLWNGTTEVEVMTMLPNGNVGIGMTNPGYLLEVNGTIATKSDIRWSGSGLNAADKKLYSPADGDLEWMTSNAAGVHGFAVSNQGTKLVYLNSSGNSYFNGGNLGIGTASPSYNLHVTGTIYASGDITAFSDQRYKQNIIRLDRSLNKVLQLGGYSYTREDYRPGEKQIGLLAQEVLTVFPEAVSHDSTNDKYSVNYGCLIAPMVESIKELQDQITVQNQLIESQGKTIQLLLARLNLSSP